jgi:L-rhamnose mutarotase
MERVAFIMHINDEKDAEEYLRRHDEIWPEMVEALRGAGIRNYSIYRQGTTLFAYLECEDFARMAATLRDDPVNQRWGQYMRPMMTIEVDPATGWPHRLPEMFHMD